MAGSPASKQGSNRKGWEPGSAYPTKRLLADHVSNGMLQTFHGSLSMKSAFDRLAPAGQLKKGGEGPPPRIQA